MKAPVICVLICGVLGGLSACSDGAVPRGDVATIEQAASVVPEVGPEIGTDTPVPVQAEYGNAPDVASDGTGYVAVFEDSSVIRAVRVDETGTVLDMPWLIVSQPDTAAGVSQGAPSVAFGGGRYLVTWEESDGIDAISIRGRLLLPDGTLEGSTSFPISSGRVAGSPSVAYNGETFVVAWMAILDEPLAYDVRITLVGADGNVVAGSERTVSTGSRALAPAVASGTDVTVVAWQDQQTDVGLIRAARITKNGTVQDPGGLRMSDGTTTEDELEVGTNGTDFLVAWRKEGSPSVIRASVLTEAGAVTAKDFAVSRSTVETGSPSVGHSGGSFLVAWADDRDERSVYGAAVSAAGVVAGTADTKVGDGAPWQLLNNNTTLAAAASQFLVAFHGKGIQGALIDADLDVLQGNVALSPLPNKQSSPNVAWTGENYVVAWIDERAPSFQDYSARAVRIDPEGDVLDPDGLLISADKTAFSLDTASNGKGHDIVVWANADQRAFQRSIASDGTLSAITDVMTSGQSTSPAIATNGDGYLVVYSDSQTSTTASISGRLLDASGAAAPPFVIEPAAQIDFADALPAGQDYLVRYRKAGTWLVPVSRTGAVGEAMQLSSALAMVNSATNGEHTLVVWTDIQDNQVRGRIVSAGAWQGSAFVISATSAGYGAAVAWDGTTYWVVWENDPDLHPLWARSVSATGAQTTPALLVADDCNAPTLASDGNGQMLLSYYKYSEAARVRRVVSRLLGKVPVVTGEGGAGGAGGAPAEPSPAGAAGEPGTTGGNAGTSGSPGASSGSGGGGRAGAPSAGATSNGGTSGQSAGAAGSGTGGDPEPGGCSVSGAGTGSRSNVAWTLCLLAMGLAMTARRRDA